MRTVVFDDGVFMCGGVVMRGINNAGVVGGKDALAARLISMNVGFCAGVFTTDTNNEG